MSRVHPRLQSDLETALVTAFIPEDQEINVETKQQAMQAIGASRSATTLLNVIKNTGENPATTAVELRARVLQGIKDYEKAKSWDKTNVAGLAAVSRLVGYKPGQYEKACDRAAEVKNVFSQVEVLTTTDSDNIFCQTSALSYSRGALTMYDRQVAESKKACADANPAQLQGARSAQVAAAVKSGADLDSMTANPFQARIVANQMKLRKV